MKASTTPFFAQFIQQQQQAPTPAEAEVPGKPIPTTKKAGSCGNDCDSDEGAPRSNSTPSTVIKDGK